ncbi:MAG: phage holin family protein [Calothrix sp. C42_A2020_038]|nr:phage holin family protein [Calothrix sp. C42_A2020_038]
MNITSLLVAWLVTAASFFVISKLPIGVEIDSPDKTFVSAAVLGIITALVKPTLSFVFRIPNALTFNLFPDFFTFVIAVICFCLAAYFVQGFRLRYGIWSAIMGAFALAVVSNIIYRIIPY